MLAMVGTFYVVAIALAVWSKRQRGGLDEVHGLEPQFQHWKS